MKPMKFGLGQPVKRVEDAKFITGQGQYTADVAPDGTLHAVMVRSPHAHATFVIGETAAALAVPGVRLILTAADVAHLGSLPCLAPVTNTDGSAMALPLNPVLPNDTVRHVGDAVALVVAESLYAAQQGIEALDIDYSAQPAVTEVNDAIAAGVPSVWSEAPGNIVYDKELGDKAGTDAAFAAAARVVSLTVVNNRLIVNYMEPRAAIGEYDPATGRYTLTTGSQGVHGLKDVLCNTIMKIAPETLRVVTPDVGGGFGIRAVMYREYPLLLVAAEKTGRPVKWVADRSDHFIGDAQGRDNHTKAELALDHDGRFLAMRVDILANLGAYLSQFGPDIPWLGATMATGAYDIPMVHVRCRGIHTNTVPVDAYRGAGRSEAAYVLERLVDNCARETGLPREEIRARNFVKASQMPFTTRTEQTYDVGDFEGAMREALSEADYAGFEARAKGSAGRGRVRGIGFSSYVENTAWGAGEEGSVSLEADGTFTVLVGTQSNGQGHATAYAQTVSHYLDVPPGRILVVQGDTDRVRTGNGTGGSRSIPVGVAMVSRASDALARKLKELAADELEAAVADRGGRLGRYRISWILSGGPAGLSSFADIGSENFKPPRAVLPIDRDKLCLAFGRQGSNEDAWNCKRSDTGAVRHGPRRRCRRRAGRPLRT